MFGLNHARDGEQLRRLALARGSFCRAGRRRALVEQQRLGQAADQAAEHRHADVRRPGKREEILSRFLLGERGNDVVGETIKGGVIE